MKKFIFFFTYLSSGDILQKYLNETEKSSSSKHLSFVLSSDTVLLQVFVYSKKIRIFLNVCEKSQCEQMVIFDKFEFKPCELTNTTGCFMMTDNSTSLKNNFESLDTNDQQRRKCLFFQNSNLPESLQNGNNVCKIV